jgi:tetratricopeptide (TPR) repeat protein
MPTNDRSCQKSVGRRLRKRLALILFDPMPPDARARQPLAKRVIERVALILGALPSGYTSLAYGVTFRSVGNRRQTIKVFTRLIKNDGKQAERWLFRRAGAYLYFGLPQKALEDYDKAVGQGGSIRSSSDLAMRGNAHLDLGHFELAMRDYREAIEIYRVAPSQHYPDALRFRAEAYASVGRFAEAIEDLNELISQHEALVGYCRRAYFLLKLGDYDRALSDYDEAIRRWPKEAAVYMERAKAYVGRQDELAIKDFREAIRLSSEVLEWNKYFRDREIAKDTVWEARETIRMLSRRRK